MRSTILLLFVFTLCSAGCHKSGIDGPVVVVKVSYPGANAQVLVDTVAAPVEQQINGVENMIRMESESRNYGSYIAYIHFKPTMDPNLAVTLVQQRVALAKPVLPDAARQVDVLINVKDEKENDKDRVCIALLDRGNLGWKAQKDFSEAVLKRISSNIAIMKPELFPKLDEKQAYLDIDREKCKEYGVHIEEVFKAVKAATTNDIEVLKSLQVNSANGHAITLGQVADVKFVDSPRNMYRVDMYPAVRITGLSPKGKTSESAASQCVELADAERKLQQNSELFKVLNLTGQ